MDNLENNIPFDLILSSLKGELDSTGSATLNTWREEGKNRILYEKIKYLYRKAEIAARTHEFDAEEAWKGLQRIIARRKAVRFSLALSGVAAGLALAFFLGRANLPKSPLPEQETSTSVFSPVQGKGEVSLSDGTRITLSQASRITVGSDFGISERKVTLEGRGYFDVATDSLRPFEVVCGNVSVDVKGTAFEVVQENDRVSVSLQRGKVQLKSAQGGYATLSPGEKGECGQDGVFSVRSIDTETAFLWASPCLTFSKDNLGTICKRLSAWYGTEVTCDSSLAGRYALSFTITSESLSEILSLMKSVSGIRWKTDSQGNIHITNY